jgi:L-seryl-tRNA(Ser) seleniumtransferase
VPRTDIALADPRLAEPTERLGRALVKRAVVAAQDQARAGQIEPAAVVDTALAALGDSPSTLHPVINATGVVLHTNLGRAPLSAAAIAAMSRAAGYVDVEFDLMDGRRARRGRGVLEALRAAVPSAPDVLVVNNGAAALVLATTTLAAGAEVIISRGEMVEIGDGFRLPDLIESTGAVLREVGTTNRVTRTDYAGAVSPTTAAILKVHPSNFRIDGFTSAVPVHELAEIGPPVIVDIGSGLLRPDAGLPDEPDVTTMLAEGAALVTCSGDKLVGGPQAGLVFGHAALIDRLRRHPLARALRVDKTTLAALEATLIGPTPPATVYRNADPAELRARCQVLAAKLQSLGASVVASIGAVGGGSAPGIALAGWAVELPPAFAEALRRGRPAVVARVERGRCLLDLRCVDEDDDDRVAAAVLAAALDSR